MRLILFLFLTALLLSCSSKKNCTSISCQTEKNKSKKETFFSTTKLNKKHKKPKQGLFKKGILPKSKN